MSEYLFSTFDPVSTEEWKKRIEADLKGRDYNKTLVWESPDGITVKPFYNSSDMEALLNRYGTDSLPADMPGEGNDWTLLVKVIVDDISAANSEALEALMNGAGGIYFDLRGKTVSSDQLNQLVKDIHVEAAPVSVTNYSGILSFKDLDGTQGGLCVLHDILLDALRKNTYDIDDFWNNDWSVRKAGSGPNEAFTVDGFVFKDAGANIVQELAFSLALANEYLNQGCNSGTVRFRMGLSGNFFFEIAKLRALRRLWAVLSDQYGSGGTDLHIESRSSVINKSILDQHVNMLRNTAECMAGAIGGSDSILLSNHDALSGNSPESRRWARNVSLVLKNEAYLDKVSDPARGSYFVEAVTDQLCEAAWQLFRELEANGGFISAWISGRIQTDVSKSLSVQLDDLAVRRSTLIGVNDYPNDNDLVAVVKSGEDSLELAPVRLAAQFEALRASTEDRVRETGTRPEAYLLTSGKPAIMKARVNYASNFLGCAGIASKESEGTMTFENEVAHINTSSYAVVVICSDNESWPEILEAVKGLNKPLILAGNSSSLEDQLRNIPDHSIYQGCNVIQTLEEIQHSIFS